MTDDVRCLVGPVRAEVTPTAHNVWYGDGVASLGDRPPNPPRCCIRAPGATPSGCSDVGARLCVMGELRSHSEVGDVDRRHRREAARVEAGPGGAARRFDLDHDGQLDAAEWEAARQAAARECADAGAAFGRRARQRHLQPTNGEPFLIAP